MEIEHKQELRKKEKKIQLLLEEAEKIQESEQMWREKCRELETVRQRITTKTPVKKITRSPRTTSASNIQHGAFFNLLRNSYNS